MAKKSLKITLLLSLLFICPSCLNIESTYQRKDIEQAIKKVCLDDYGLKVKTEEIGDTLWIYAPFDNLTTEEGALEEEADEKIRNVILSLHRVMLSIDAPPKFYAFVASDVENVGADFILIGFVPDIIKVQLKFISRDDFFKRRFLRFSLNPKALGDEEGDHIQRFNLTLPRFISLLTEQRMINIFTRGKDSSSFDFKTCKVNFDPQARNFHIKMDIEEKDEEEPAEELPSPFEEALKASAYYINKTYDFEDFVYVKIEDLASGKIQSLNKKALEEVDL